MRTVAKKILIKTGLLPLFSAIQLKKTYLDPLGWSKSILTQRSIDLQHHSLPWMNYNIISLLSERNLKNAKVLEYGSGSSTYWWSSRAKNVLSIEHGSYWFDKCKIRQPSNVELRLSCSDDSYPSIVSVSDGPFDIVVIDALHRVACAIHILPMLSKNGVIIWDDSERDSYIDGYKHLFENGFRRIRFFGVKPGASKPAATDIFYKDDNVLGI